MKNNVFFFLLLVIISCGKNGNKSEINIVEETSVPPYDTIAKDSFSAGAVSVDIARRIRMSSQVYQDSMREVRKKMEEEKLANQLKQEKELADKKAEDEAKAKKEKEQKPAETPPIENTQNP